MDSLEKGQEVLMEDYMNKNNFIWSEDVLRKIIMCKIKCGKLYKRHIENH